MLSIPLETFYERVAGIEPASQPWEGRVLPLNHTRRIFIYIRVNEWPYSVELAVELCAGTMMIIVSPGFL
jgi:hypothetical protein